MRVATLIHCWEQQFSCKVWRLLSPPCLAALQLTALEKAFVPPVPPVCPVLLHSQALCQGSAILSWRSEGWRVSSLGHFLLAKERVILSPGAKVRFPATMVPIPIPTSMMLDSDTAFWIPKSLGHKNSTSSHPERTGLCCQSHSCFSPLLTLGNKQCLMQSDVPSHGWGTCPL